MLSPAANAKAPSNPTASGDAGQCQDAPGSRAAIDAIQMITCADQAAPKPAQAASVPFTSDRPAARKPSTVAGDTRGPAAALAKTPTTLTRPEMAATTGRVARCAASGTASDSARTLGIHRCSCAVHPGAQPMMPALAVPLAAHLVTLPVV